MRFSSPWQVAVEAANPEEYKVLTRLALTKTTGAVQLWQQDQLRWSREEGLADIRAAELLELPERKVASQVDHERETFGARVARQLHDAQVRAQTRPPPVNFRRLSFCGRAPARAAL